MENLLEISLILNLFLLIAFFVSLIYAVRLYAIKEFLDEERINKKLENIKAPPLPKSVIEKIEKSKFK